MHTNAIQNLKVGITYSYKKINFIITMPRNHLCKFKVTKSQLEDIQRDAQSRGYIKLAPYLRDLALSRSGLLEAKIAENNRLIKQLLEVQDGGNTRMD